MKKNSFHKKNYEQYTINADFNKNLGLGESISSQTVTAADRGGEDVSATVLNQESIDNNGAGCVSVLVRGGESGSSPYTLNFRCVTSEGYKWELDITMHVID